MRALLANPHFFNNNRVGNNGKSVSHFKSGNNATYGSRGSFARKGTFKKDEEGFQNRDHQHCEHCGMIGHSMADWYKMLKNQRSQGAVRTNLVNTS